MVNATITDDITATVRARRIYRPRRHRQRAHAEREQRQGFDRTARHLAAHADVDAGRPRLLHYKM